MRGSYATAGLAVALGTVMWALPSATASSSGDDDHGDHDDRSVIRVTSREVDSADLDLGKRGFGIGDRFVFTDNLFRDGMRVGTDHGECVITRVQGRGGAFQCSATAVIRGNQITVQGAVVFRGADPSRFALAITGGTGRFRDAGGQVVVKHVGPRSDRLTFQLED